MPDPTSDTLDRIYDRIAQAAPAGVWSGGRLVSIMEPAEALGLAASTEQEFAASLRS